MALNLVKSEMPIAPGYSFVREQTKTGLEQASRAGSLPCVSRNFRPALSANGGGSLHLMGRPSAPSIKYCNKFSGWLRSQNSNQVAQLIFNITWQHHRVSDFFAQQLPIALTQSMERLLHGVLGHAQFTCNLCLRRAI